MVSFPPYLLGKGSLLAGVSPIDQSQSSIFSSTSRICRSLVLVIAEGHKRGQGSACCHRGRYEVEQTPAKMDGWASSKKVKLESVNEKVCFFKWHKKRIPSKNILTKYFPVYGE